MHIIPKAGIPSLSFNPFPLFIIAFYIPGISISVWSGRKEGRGEGAPPPHSFPVCPLLGCKKIRRFGNSFRISALFSKKAEVGRVGRGGGGAEVGAVKHAIFASSDKWHCVRRASCVAKREREFEFLSARDPRT